MNMEISGKDFISVVIPYFCRPHYLHRLIDSVHKYADMPFELLIHDDGSTDESQPEVFSELHRTSTVLFDTGPCLGLSASVNRLVKLSSSDYIFWMASDCELVNPYFKDLVDILKHPYIGILGADGCISNERLFNIIPGVGSDYFYLAFRKEVWEETGGLNEEMFTLFSDVSFVTSVLKKGYFAALPRCPNRIMNMSRVEQGGRDSTIRRTDDVEGEPSKGFDNSYPRIFGIGNLDEISWKRAKTMYHRLYAHVLEPEHEVNVAYWDGILRNIVGSFATSGRNFNWGGEDKYGHSRWKDIIADEYPGVSNTFVIKLPEHSRTI